MPLTHLTFAFGLIGVLTGTRFRTEVLVFVTAVTFAIALISLLVSGYSIWISFLIAFKIIFILQFFYLIGVALLIGKTELTRRVTALIAQSKALPR